MKNLKLIIGLLLVFIAINKIECMENDAMDYDSQESYQEDISKKRKRDEGDKQSLINTQDDSCDISELKKFKIEEISQDSELLNLPHELLLYIFEYCVAIPNNFSYGGLHDLLDKSTVKRISGLVKESCLNRARIFLVCKEFFDYKYFLDPCAKKYFNYALKFIVQGFMDEPCMHLKPGENGILLLLKAGADPSMTFLDRELRYSNNGVLEVDQLVEKSLNDLIFIDILWSDKHFVEAYASEMTNIDDEDAEGNTLLMRAALKTDGKKTAFLFLGTAGLSKISVCRKLHIFEFIIKLLIANGADVNKVNKKGETALIMLIKYSSGFNGFDECLRELCSQSMLGRIDVNVQDGDGNTALMLLGAVKDCPTYKKLFELIAAHNANFDLKNKAGKNLIQMARSHRRKFIKEFIAKMKSQNAGNCILSEA